MITGFHDVLFPSRLAFGSVGGPEIRVDIVQLASGFEKRNARGAIPKRKYTISTGQRPIEELRELAAFFEARGGPLNGFRFRDPVAHSTALDQRGISAQDVQIGIGDGTQTHFGLQLSHGRYIRAPRIGTIRLAIDGVEKQAGFEFDFDLGTVVFDVAPSDGANISAGFEYDVPVRFENEHLAIANTASGAGEVAEVTLLEVLI